MKRPIFFLRVGLTIFLFSLSRGQESKEIELEKIKTPIWSDEVIKKQEKGDKNVIVYGRNIFEKPPFYDGPLPLTFMLGRFAASYGVGRDIIHNFKNFVNIFIYIDRSNKSKGIPNGARTVGTGNKMLAEARLLQLPRDATKQPQQIEIEEFHYDADGKLKFKCKSKIDFSSGFKIGETEATGKKTEEYYFIWPVKIGL